MFEYIFAASLCCCIFFVFFFFKQKTAYEMRISDWSSDVCSSDLLAVTDTLSYGGPRDVVALSVGAREGIDNGTVFSIWREGSNVVDRVEHSAEFPAGAESFDGKVRLPDEYAGHVIVFRTYDKVSSGLVMDSTKPTRIGYNPKHPDAPY